jgi:hypothetical protein
MATMIDDQQDRQLHQVFRDALRSDVPFELERDLWPRMHAQLAARPRAPSLLDWALLAAIAVAAATMPHVLIGVLYNL